MMTATMSVNAIAPAKACMNHFGSAGRSVVLDSVGGTEVDTAEILVEYVDKWPGTGVLDDTRCAMVAPLTERNAVGFIAGIGATSRTGELISSNKALKLDM